MKWKVPGRSIITFSFLDWVKSIVWCYFVLKIWPHIADFGSDALMGIYLEEPELFMEQYFWHVYEVNGLPVPRKILDTTEMLKK